MNSDRLNKEALSIAKHARYRGFAPVITSEDGTLTLSINAGLAGWLSVTYLSNPFTGRLNRSAAEGVLACANGTHARKVQPATLANIINAIEALFFASKA